jgi:hypothetical protein
MMSKKLKLGSVVKIDADNPEWGRVVGHARIIELPSSKLRRVLVDAFSIRAYILVRRDEILSQKHKKENIS